MKRLIPFAILTVALCRAEAARAQQDVPYQTVTGVITQVRPAEKQILLKVRKNEVLVLAVDDRTRIDFPQTEGKLANLKEGKRVRVSFYVKDGANRLLSLTEPVFTLGKLKQG